MGPEVVTPSRAVGPPFPIDKRGTVVGRIPSLKIKQGRPRLMQPIPQADYHPFVPTPEQSKIAGPTPRAHAQARIQSPRAKDLFGTWEKMFAEPFRGITTDGRVIPDLFVRKPEGAPTQAMIDAVGALLARL